MDTERVMDYTLSVGDTALVVDSDPEVMVKITTVLGKDRVLGELLYGEDAGAQHGYDRKQLRKRFSIFELASQMNLKIN
jgi:hypothetical protein